MKKLVSICFLSILFSMFSAKAQESPQTNCCFWVENMQPVTLTNISNYGDDGVVVLNHLLNTPVRHQTDIYEVNFTNNCNLPANTKISIEWEVWRDGVLLQGNLNDYANIVFQTHYNELHWLGGAVATGNAIPQDYPGAIQQYEGNYNIVNHSLDYFYMHFFDYTRTRMMITWQQVGNYKIILKLRERIHGTDFPSLYYDSTQTLNIGGHQSQPGRLLATDTLSQLYDNDFTKEVCENDLPFVYGLPNHDYTTTGQYEVLFVRHNDACNYDIIDSLIHLDFYVRSNPPAPIVDPNPINFCKNDQNADEIPEHNLAQYVTSANTENFARFEWSTTPTFDNILLDAPTVSVSTARTYHYYVRQVNYYELTGIECIGAVTDITVIVNPLPSIPSAPNDVYYCLNDDASPLSATTGAENSLQWSTDAEFTNPQSTPFTPSTDAVGVTNYYVRAVNATTFCYGPTRTIKVKVWALPTLVASANETNCSGFVIELTASITAPSLGTKSYSWTREPDEVDPIFGTKTGSRVNDRPTYVGDLFQDYNYIVVGTQTHIANSNGFTSTAACVSYDTATVRVYPIPNTPALEDTTLYICDEGSVTFETTDLHNGTTARWYWLDEEEEVNVLSGTTPNSNLPFGGNYRSSQQIYLKSEIDDDVNTIKGIAFKYNGNSNVTRTISIQLKNITQSSFSGTSSISGSTEVFNGSYTFTTDNDGWNTIYFNNEFVYNNTKNLLVSINYIGSNNSTSHLSFATTPTTKNLAIRSSLFYNTVSFRNTIKLINAIHEYEPLTPASGTEYTYTISDVPDDKPTDTTTLYVTNYNDTTDCESDYVPFYIVRYRVPQVDILDHAMICPSQTFNFEAPITREGALTSGNTYTYYWSENTAGGEVSTTTLEATAVCGQTYPVSVYVIDNESNCQSQTDVKEFVANDTQAPVINPLLDTTIVYGCGPDAIPAAATTPGELSQITTISDNCSPLDSLTVTSSLSTPIDIDCDIHIDRTYIVTDLCGNSTEFIHHFIVRDTVKPTMESNVVVDAFISNDCKYYIPDVIAEVLENLNPQDNCTPTSRLDITQSPAANTEITENTDVWIRVMDACGNFINENRIQVVIPEPLTINEIISTVGAFCLGGTDTLTAFVSNGSGATWTYSWTSNNPSTINPNDASVVYVTPETVGITTFTLTVVDENNCVATRAIDIEAYSVPVVTIAQQEDVCPNAGIIPITTTIVGGTAPFEYAWDGESIDRASVISSTSAYIVPTVCDTVYTPVVFVVDAHGCTATDDMTFSSYDHVAPVSHDFSVELQLNDNCEFIVPDFTDQVKAITTDHCYSVNELTYTQVPAANTVITDNTQVAVTITDFCDNSTTINVSITVIKNYPQVELVADVNAYCLGGTSNLTATPENGILPYSYQWEATPADGSGLTSINNNEVIVTPTVDNTYDYVVTLTDGHNCTATATTQVTAYHIPNMNDFGVDTEPNQICAGDPNGSITINSIENPGYGYKIIPLNAYTYGVDSTQYQISFPGLDDGTYRLYVISEHGCTFDSCVLVYPAFSVPEIDYTVVNNTVCDGEYDGSITINNPIPGCTYTLGNDSQECESATDIISFINKPDGFYTLVVVSTQGCDNEEIIEVGFDDENFNITTQVTDNSNCSGNTPNGQLEITHPLGDYTYKVKNNLNTSYYNKTQSSPIFDGLGNTITSNVNYYTVTVTNNYSGCTSSATIIVRHTYEAYDFSVATTPDTNCNNSGSGSITINGDDNASYKFKLNVSPYNSFVADTVFTDLKGTTGGRTYTITAKNNINNCTTVQSTSIIRNEAYPTFELTSTPDSYCDNTIGSDGTIIVSNPSPAVLTFNNVNSISINDEMVYSPLADGVYTVVATNDVNGCTASSTVTIEDETVTPEATATTDSNTYCHVNEFNGVVTIAPTAGFTYNFNNNGFTEENVYDGLNAGDYTIQVKSDKGCVSSIETVTVNDGRYYAPVILSSVNNNVCDINLNPNGRIIIVDPRNNFEYRLEKADGTLILDYTTPMEFTYFHLTQGTYRVTARNLTTYCVSSAVDTVEFEAVPIEANFATSPNTICGDNKNGVISAIVTNPQPLVTYLYSIDGGIYGTNNVFNNVAPVNHTIQSNHTIQIKIQQYGCVYTFGPIIVDDNSGNDMPDFVISNSHAEHGLCPGQNGSVVLTATPNNSSLYSYSWSNDAITNQISVNPDNTTIYTLTVTDLVTNCTKVVNESVVVNVLPNPTIYNNGNEICADVTENIISVSPSNYHSYLWSTDDTTVSINAIVDDSNEEVYTVTVTDVNGCTGTASYNLTVHPLPIPMAIYPAQICEGDDIIFQASSVENGHTWYYNGINHSGSTFEVEAPQSDVTVILEDTNSFGCTARDTFTVQINQKPEPPVFAKNSLSSLNLYYCTSATGVNASELNFVEVTDVTFSFFEQDNSTSTPLEEVPTTEGVYYARAFNGCWSDPSTVTIATVTNPSFTVTLQANTNTPTEDYTSCYNSGEIIPLTYITVPQASATLTFEPTYSPNDTVFFDESLNAGTHTYSVSVVGTLTENGISCTTTETANLQITVNALPETPNDVTNYYCVGQVVEALPVAPNGYSYIWFDEDQNPLKGTPSVTTVVPDTIIYYFQQVNESTECISAGFGTFTSIIYPNPVVNIAANPTAICQGETSVISTLPDTNIYTYIWNNNITTASFTSNVLDITTQFTVTVSQNFDDNKTCTTTDDVTVTVESLPEIPTITGTNSNGSEVEFEALNNNELFYCIGGTPNFDDNITLSPILLYSLSNNSYDSLIPFPDTAGTYYFYNESITDLHCKSGYTVVTVVEKALPVLDITASIVENFGQGANTVGEDNTICQGQKVQLCVVSNTVALDSYNWSNASATSCIQTTEAGIYSITATDVYGCINTASYTLNVRELPVVSVTTDSVCFRNEAHASAVVEEDVTYLWNNNALTGSITLSNLVVGSHTYTVTVTTTDDNACVNSASNVVVVWELPDYFLGNDTIICPAGTATLPVRVDGGDPDYTFYACVNGDTLIGTNSGSDHYDFLITLDLPDSYSSYDYLITFKVEDTHGCVANPVFETIDLGFDTIQSRDTAVVVTVTDHPFIKFTTPEVLHSVTGDPTEYGFFVDFNPDCIDSCAKVRFEYQIFKDGVEVLGNAFSQYVTNDNAMTFAVDMFYNNQAQPINYNTLSQDYSFAYTYGDGFIPDDVNGRDNFTIGSLQYGYFNLHFVNNRLFNVSINNWSEPGVYEFKFKLVSYSEGPCHNEIYLTSPDPCQNCVGDSYQYPLVGHLIGGHNVNDMIEVLAENSIKVYVTGESVQRTERLNLGIDSQDGEAASMSVYPNPTNNDVNIQLNGVEGQSTIKITDMSGKVIDMYDVNVTPSETIFTYNVSTYAQGIYFINVINNNAVLTKKLVIQK